MTVLSNRALLVNLRISQWTARKLDRKASDTVQGVHNTTDKAGNYTKKLLPGSAELGEVATIASEIRMFFYQQTLPWFSDGSRILSAKNYMDFNKAIGCYRGRFQAAVDTFLLEYPRLRDQARSQLGDLFQDGEYPSVGSLRQAFDCDVAFMPVPAVEDFRTEILDSEKDEFIKRMHDVETGAMRECWTRLYDVVGKAAGKLEQPEGIFRDSLLENIHEMVALLPKLNVTDDPELEDMRRKVERAISGLTPDTLRHNSTLRERTATTLDDLSAKMSAYMGAV